MTNLAILRLSLVAAAACSFHYSEIQFNGFAYRLTVPSADWLSAERYCRSSGGHLASIRDLNEARFIKSAISNGFQTTAWIGLRVNDSGAPEWIDGVKSNYTKWRAGFPTEGPSCVFMSYDMTWIDGFCDAELPFVCKLPLNLRESE